MPQVKKQTRTRKKVVKSGIESRIQNLGEGFDEGIKLNIYGRSATGKTTFWSTFPGKILAIICSGGSKPGELRSINTAENRKKIKQIVVTDPSDIGEIVDLVNHSDDFNTVVLDHASGLQDLTLKTILGLEELPPQSSWGMARQQDWGQCALQMKEMLRALLNLSCNVVIVAQEREFSSTEDGEIVMPYVGSALTPSVTGWLNPACDYICQTFIRPKRSVKKVKVGKKVVEKEVKLKGVEYCLRVGPDAVFTTKFRLPRSSQELPDVIVDPTFEKVNELLSKGK